jgi:hypothetical protein
MPNLIGFAPPVIAPCLALLLSILIFKRPTRRFAYAPICVHMDAHFDAFHALFDAQSRSLAEKLQPFEERIDARLARTERLFNLT